ncbi:MAG: NAD(P)-dependent oxidoreductase [Bacteroidetes bacterium]|nr:NAD(P)-dependent oxidoreductase [Bacteroidota bacterium]
MMNILVTGGAGYKGTKLTEKLLERGYKVTVFDNFMYGYESLLHIGTHKNLTVIKGDIRNGVPNIQTFDAIFHLAGISGFPACAANPHSAHLINVDATRKLLETLSKEQILINASTTSFYGKSGSSCTEDTMVDPVSTYGMTKYEAEKIIQERENAISLRFATVFGISPKMRMDLMVNDFVYKAMKEGVLVLFDSFAKRTFIHIDDAVACYLFTLDHYSQMKGQVFNAGGEHLNYTKLEIAQAIKNKIEFTIIDSEMKDKDLRHFLVSFSKIRNLGFIPAKTIEDGIDEMIKVYSFYEYFSHYRII